jgi:hypothetical protein
LTLAAPRTTDPRAEGKTLADLLVGQTIRRLETEIMLRDGRLATEIEWESRDLVRIWAKPIPDPALTRETGLRATLALGLTPGRKRTLILTPSAPTVRRYHRGDGQEHQKLLSELLVGQTLQGLHSGEGWMTDEGAGTTAFEFASGDWALCWPLLTTWGWLPTWAIPGRTNRLIVAGYGTIG